MYGFKIVCEISSGTFEISHKILNPYTAKYIFYCLVFLRIGHLSYYATSLYQFHWCWHRVNYCLISLGGWFIHRKIKGYTCIITWIMFQCRLQSHHEYHWLPNASKLLFITGSGNGQMYWSPKMYLDIFKLFFLNEKLYICIQISLKCIPDCPVINKAAFVQIMDGRRTGDKPSFEPMMPYFTDAYMCQRTSKC